MRRRRRVLSGAAAAVLVAIPAGWYLGSPWWTLWRTGQAARAADPGRLDDYVDYPAVAAESEARHRAAWTSLIRTVRPDTPAARHLIALARRDSARPAPDPGAVRAELRPWLASLRIGSFGPGPGGGRGAPLSIVRRGLDGFEVRDEGASLKFGPVLTYRRRGLGWKLVAVRWGQR